MQHRSVQRVTRPGDLNGDRPKVYELGRVCACGAKISKYNSGDVCAPCERRGSPPPGGKDMARTEAIKTKDVAALLGVSTKRATELGNAGNFSIVRRGKPGISSTWNAAEVIAFAKARATMKSEALREKPITSRLDDEVDAPGEDVHAQSRAEDEDGVDEPAPGPEEPGGLEIGVDFGVTDNRDLPKLDPELEAIARILNALEDLEPLARGRIIAFVTYRLEVEFPK